MDTRLIVLLGLVLTASFITANAVNEMLVIPATLTIYSPPPPPHTYWVANVTSFEFGEVQSGQTSQLIPILVTNDSSSNQTLVITSPNLPENMTLLVGIPISMNEYVSYTPTLIPAHSSITLFIAVTTDVVALDGIYHFSISCDTL